MHQLDAHSCVRRKVFLSKRVGWIVLAALVFMDAFLDIIRGYEGNPLWIPVVNIIGINAVPFLVPFVLVSFYLAIKALAWVVRRIDKLPHAEEILLTAFVLVYATFDIWLISVFFGFSLIRSFYHTIPLLIAVGLGYALWAEYAVKKKK